MLRRLIFACSIILCVVTSLYAQEAGSETSLRVYRVGDLVSQNAFLEQVSENRISPEDWGAEHSETLESLERLSDLVSVLCNTKPAATVSHRETLSLVVRHTEDGHNEVQELLVALRVGEEPTIRLTCHLICHFESEYIQSLPEEKQQLFDELMYQKTLTPTQAQQLREVADPSFAKLSHTFDLVEGRKTPFAMNVILTTATARIDQSKNLIQLRLDNVNDDVSDTMPVSVQVFDIEEGFSANWLHQFDGASSLWQITPSIIEPGNDANSVVQAATTFNVEQADKTTKE